ncbi:hypothetical protein [Amycolatopsis sp. NBC_01480]|uniref:hypothetical protein n=1 Tax=Amycolatopsis sp. NBC_01480 TaxID=2903562 RepID=UPI002E2B1B97|nr:hypothetical protein [Amycolatopsis sp. NBC_01480]
MIGELAIGRLVDARLRGFVVGGLVGVRPSDGSVHSLAVSGRLVGARSSGGLVVGGLGGVRLVGRLMVGGWLVGVRLGGGLVGGWLAGAGSSDWSDRSLLIGG